MKCRKTSCFGYVNEKGIIRCDVLTDGAEKPDICPFYKSKQDYAEQIDALDKGQHGKFMRLTKTKPVTIAQLKDWLIRAEAKFPTTDKEVKAKLDAFLLGKEATV